jgi:hypothetical protein
MRPKLLMPALVGAMLAASAAVTQEATIASDRQSALDPTRLLTAASVEGSEIYSINQGEDVSFWDSGDEINFVTTNWNSIGRVQDVIIDRNGTVVGVTTDVGGFLGIGRRTVLLMLDDIRLVVTENDELVVVTRLAKDRLEQLDELSGVFGYD